MNNLWTRLNSSALIRFLLLLACGWGLVQILTYFKTVIVIFSLAAIVAFLLSYPVRWLHRFVPHSAAVSLVFLLSLLAIASLTIAVGLKVLAQGQQLLDSISLFLTSLTPLVEHLETSLRSRNLQVNLRVIQEPLQTQILTAIGYVLSNFQTYLINFFTLVLIAVVAFFMLLDGERLWQLVLKAVPKERQKEFTIAMQRSFLGFFRGQLILCLFLTVTSLILFLILQIPFALVLSLIAGGFDLIPGIGATLGISLIFLLLLSQNVWLALKALIACILLQQIQDNLIAPRIMQNAVNINPVIIFFSLLVGARVAGLLGIFLAVPITGVLVSLLKIEEMKGELSADKLDL